MTILYFSCLNNYLYGFSFKKMYRIIYSVYKNRYKKNIHWNEIFIIVWLAERKHLLNLYFYIHLYLFTYSRGKALKGKKAFIIIKLFFF